MTSGLLSLYQIAFGLRADFVDPVLNAFIPEVMWFLRKPCFRRVMFGSSVDGRLVVAVWMADWHSQGIEGVGPRMPRAEQVLESSCYIKYC